MDFKNVCVLGLSGAKHIIGDVCKNLHIKPIEVVTSHFADGEIMVKPNSTVRHNRVVVIQSLCKPVNETLMELLICIDSLKRASAKEIVVILTYYAYARQDRKASEREPITAKLVAKLLEKAGAQRVITIDIHSQQIQGFFDIPLDSITIAPFILKEAIKNLNRKNLTVVAPDYGSVKRARSVAELINASLAILDKRRPKPNVVEIQNILGEVKNKNCLIVDDMIDTAGTICGGVNAIKKAGAKTVSVIATHGVLSSPAQARLTACFKNKTIDKLYLSNTILHVHNFKSEHVKIVDISKLVANVISVICSKNASLSQLMKKYSDGLTNGKTHN